MFVDDPALTQSYTEQEESIWEMIAIKESAVVNWSVKGMWQINLLPS